VCLVASLVTGSGCARSFQKPTAYVSRYSDHPRTTRNTGEMAEHLASIYGTEKVRVCVFPKSHYCLPVHSDTFSFFSNIIQDRVNCPFYFKIGACRHGEKCSRLHMRPTLSQTIMMTNMYENPEYAAATGSAEHMQMSKTQTQDHFEDFYQDGTDLSH
jgi:hypothetical protein